MGGVFYRLRDPLALWVGEELGAVNLGLAFPAQSTVSEQRIIGRMRLSLRDGGLQQRQAAFLKDFVFVGMLNNDPCICFALCSD